MSTTEPVLKWVNVPDDEWEWAANFGRGRYTIYNEGGWYAARWRTKHHGHLCGIRNVGGFKTLEAAKDACEQDAQQNAT
jgi:hypothetical protein